MQRYTEALNDSSSGIVYPAFVGSRKQSVVQVDAEKIVCSKAGFIYGKKDATLKLGILELKGSK